jgi:hypothetical protein
LSPDAENLSLEVEIRDDSSPTMAIEAGNGPTELVEELVERVRISLDSPVVCGSVPITGRLTDLASEAT